MQCKFDLFLQQQNYPFKCSLKQLTVKKRIKQWIFDIELEEIISPNQLTVFLNDLNTFFKIREIKTINFKLSYKNYNFDSYALEYYESLVYKAGEEKAQIHIFKNYKPQYNNNSYILDLEADAKSIQRHFPFLKDFFYKYGFSVDFVGNISDKLPSIKDTVNKSIEELNDVLVKQQIAKRQEKIIDKKTSFSRKSSPTAIKIKEIPISQYEIDKYLNEKGDINFLIEGEVFKVELRDVKNSKLLTLSIADDTDAIVVKRFVRYQNDLEIAQGIKVNDFIQISGKAQYDTFAKEVVLFADAIHQLERKEKKVRKDTSKDKRVEFHINTKMSPMDAVTSAKDYIDCLIDWNHEAFAITDKNGVYAFPEVHAACKGKNIKPIYGVEIDYVDDYQFKLSGDYDFDFNLKDATYVVFDFETTGLSSTRDKIIEIAAVKVKGFEIVDRFQCFVNPNEKLSEFTKSLTNIEDAWVENAKTIDEELPRFLEFIKDCVLVAHNASFDMGVLYENINRLNLEEVKFPWIDTLNIARYYYHEELKRFNLKAVSKLFKVTLDAHHRAINDAEATANIFIQMLQNFFKEQIYTYFEINASLEPDKVWKYPLSKPIVLLAKNQIGYKNLFRLLSDALTDHYYNGPRLIRSVLEKYKEGILVGSGADQSEFFDTALYKTEDDLLKAMEIFDYIEVNPPLAYSHIAHDLGINGDDIIKSTILKIINTAKRSNKLAIATSNAHYLNPEDKKYREIYIHSKSVGGGLHPYATYEKSPEQHLLTTHEMLDSFKFLSDEIANEIVISNTKALNAQIDKVIAFPKELYSIPDDAFKSTLGIESIASLIEKMVYDKAYELYGHTLHFLVKERIEKELKSIIDNEFAPIYYISHLLVKKSLDDGYLVGSRGSVGSSLIATLLDITEVNPLRPHYRCPRGDYSVFKLLDSEVYERGINDIDKEFIDELKHAKSGYDLPTKRCPICGEIMKKDGHDIPFETFLGLEGDKVPDIDLNFSGEYQAKAHAYVRELLGEEFTFRAGTIQTVAERNAFGYVKGYLEDRGVSARNPMIEKYAQGIQGVKRSTSQHPGGIVVVPKNKTIFDVTPIQYPADDTTSTWKTTHFDYHSFEDNLLKLDILGHDDPTMIKYLMDYVTSHQDEFEFSRAQDIPLDDKSIYRLFTGEETFGFNTPDLISLYGSIASYGIPEFGTPFTRQMLLNTKPDSFAGLVKISGLSHGTDVWLKNSQELVAGNTEHGKIEFNDIIGCRDDIMIELAEVGLPPSKAFEIMEFVRKGNPSKNTVKWHEYETLMRSYGVQEWYIWSASLIKYMFPKAHATAYVIMAMRIAWFKVYKPLLFYSAFFSNRVDAFDYETMVAGFNAIRNKILKSKSETNLKVKDEAVLSTLFIALEMTKRGYKFLPVDINLSDSTKFLMEKDGLRMPFTSIDGLGSQVAEGIIEARKERPFKSRQDVLNRTKINKTVFERLLSFDALKELEDKTDELEQGLFQTFE